MALFLLASYSLDISSQYFGECLFLSDVFSFQKLIYLPVNIHIYVCIHMHIHIYAHIFTKPSMISAFRLTVAELENVKISLRTDFLTRTK